MKNSIIIILLFVFLFESSSEDFKYKRDINSVENEWHHFYLPVDIYKNVKANLSDIRIYGVKDGDTTEAPYVIQNTKSEIRKSNYFFEIINSVSKGKKYFYTLKSTEVHTSNSIELDFKNNNFDYRIKLEGSHDGTNWFTVAENQRVISIKNDNTEYSYTTLNFPDSEYRYYRISFEADEEPILKNATVSLHTETDGKYIDITADKVEKELKKDENLTEINISLKEISPVSRIQIKVNNEYDYYRSFRISYVKDSIQIKEKWNKIFQNVYDGYLSSLKENTFDFERFEADEIRIRIYNQDNEPLDIGDINFSTFTDKIVSRYKIGYDYALYYGNPKVTSPNYDIVKFTDNIPENTKELNLMTQTEISKTEKAKEESETSKIWLWIVIIAIVAGLGYYSYSLMKKT